MTAEGIGAAALANATATGPLSGSAAAQDPADAMAAEGRGAGAEAATWKNVLHKLGLTPDIDGAETSAVGAAGSGSSTDASPAPPTPSQNTGDPGDQRLEQANQAGMPRRLSFSAAIAAKPPSRVAAAAPKGLSGREDRQAGEAGAAKHGDKARARAAGLPNESSLLAVAGGVLANLPIEAPAALQTPTIAPPADGSRLKVPWEGPGSGDALPVEGLGADTQQMLPLVQAHEESNGMLPGIAAVGKTPAISGEVAPATKTPDQAPAHPLPKEIPTTEMEDGLEAWRAAARSELRPSPPGPETLPAIEPTKEQRAASNPVQAAFPPAADTDPWSPAAARPGGPAVRTFASAVAVKGARTSTPVQLGKTGGWSASATGHEKPFTAIDALPLNAPPPRQMGAGAETGERRIPLPQDTTARADPFAALDAECGAPSPAWIHAGARHAEAGYLDPALGWIGVRADASGSGVHAALVPASGEAAQVLGTHLAGLNAYLSENHGEPATVTLAAPHDAHDAGGMGAGSHASYGESARQDDPRSREGANHSPALSREGISERGSPALSTVVAPELRARGGTYLSVMA